MNPTDRRQHIALFACCGLAVFSCKVVAETPLLLEDSKVSSASPAKGKERGVEPLRVDPVLLAQSAAPDEKTAERVEHKPEPVLRAAPRIVPPQKASEPRPAFLSARRMAGEAGRELIAEGEAELRRAGVTINSDLMTYWPLKDEIEAEGSVRFQHEDDLMTGPKLKLRLEDRVGYFEQPFYQIKHHSLLGGRRLAEQEASDQQIEQLGGVSWNSEAAIPPSEKTVLATAMESRGEAERLHFEGENHYRLENSTFTTCSIDDDAWYVRTSDLKLDYDEEVGEGKNAVLYFKDVPFLYSPWVSFSLNSRRKSGFLRPSLGTSSDKGFEFQLPYYWNIAPNRDATITPRLMSRRGVQLASEYRYLNTALGGIYRGQLTAEYLPGDRLRDGRNRHGISLRHEQTAGNGFGGTIDFNKVSDNYYYTDLSSDIAATSRAQLLQQGRLTYNGGWWDASLNLQQYQTLQPDEDDPVLEQYRMLPQLTVKARKPDVHGADLNFFGEYTRFTIRERKQFGTIFPDGKRTVLYPQISLPYVKSGWYITPKLGLNYRSYSLNGQAAGEPGAISVTLPVFTVDSGMIFERPSRWSGHEYTQTLEPRLYYVDIPYKDQSRIPLFDTALADFNFAQIFSENQFSGQDRLNNAKQLTAALTSRLIEPKTGYERLRAMIGQRFYFSPNKVALSGVVDDDTRKWNRSDFLAGFGGQILPKVFIDTTWQFDPSNRKTKRYSAEIRYQPEPGKVLNAAYRLHRETNSPVNQVDLSGQWPLGGRWYGVARLNYSFKDDSTVLTTNDRGGRLIESVAGLEYNGGCWVLRGVIRRQALTSADVSTSFFVQLELSGLGRIGTNPISLLKRSIPGYSQIGSNSQSAFD